MKASTRLARIPKTNLATDPIASSLNARPKAACSTSFRCAPRATRIPSSRSRLLTEYAAIPKMPVIDNIALWHPQDAQRHRCHARTKQRNVHWLVPGFDVERHPRIQLPQSAPHGLAQESRGVGQARTRAHHKDCGGGR